MNKRDAEAVYELVTRVVASAVVGLHNGVIHPESAAKIREARQEFMDKADKPDPTPTKQEVERMLRWLQRNGMAVYGAHINLRTGEAYEGGCMDLNTAPQILRYASHKAGKQ